MVNIMGMYIKYMIKAVVRPKRSSLKRPEKKTVKLERYPEGRGGQTVQTTKPAFNVGPSLACQLKAM